jgi:hypothetical protein
MQKGGVFSHGMVTLQECMIFANNELGNPVRDLVTGTPETIC